MILVPVLVLIFFQIHHHYKRLAKQLSLDEYGAPARVGRHRVILPIGGVHRGSLAALAFARALSDDVTAVYVSIDPVEAEKVRLKWETWGGGVQIGGPGFALPVAGRAVADVHLADHRRSPTE